MKMYKVIDCEVPENVVPYGALFTEKEYEAFQKKAHEDGVAHVISFAVVEVNKFETYHLFGLRFKR